MSSQVPKAVPLIEADSDQTPPGAGAAGVSSADTAKKEESQSLMNDQERVEQPGKGSDQTKSMRQLSAELRASRPPEENPEKHTVTTEKLLKIVKLLAEVLRDPNFQGALVPDVESGVGESDSRVGFRPEQIDSIWSDVLPFRILEPAVESPNIRRRFQELFSNEEDIYKLFTSSVSRYSIEMSLIGDPLATNRADELAQGKAYACLISWRLKELERMNHWMGNPWRRVQRHSYPWTSQFNFKVLACCCLAVRSGDTRIGDILNYCYQCGVLEKPNARQEYPDQILVVFQCLFTLNFVRPLGAREQPSRETYLELGLPEQHNTKLWSSLEDYYTSLNHNLQIDFPKALGLDFHDFFKILGPQQSSTDKKTDIQCASGATFRIDDLNLQALRKIGKLSICWTAYIENHLKLDVKKSTLWVLWATSDFDHTPLSNFQEQCLHRFRPSPYQDYREDSRNTSLRNFRREIAETWAILFITKGTLRERTAEYKRISDPPWASQESLKYQNSYHLEYTANIHKKFKIMARDRDQLRYADFPILEARLRQLRHYMDSRTPSTLRQLWNDKRDTLTYYTFWGVIIFGGLSVFLAFFSLSIGIAQTIAAFKTLAITTPPAPRA
ncbi:hypothetical protein DL95DRAFT_450742 [Leptodontidium sp. 2 PMI_412]|nr:hypothetical protein DL95DRAFT_450742 [Leptodontidium sp. 2 PMI_412]